MLFVFYEIKIYMYFLIREKKNLCVFIKLYKYEINVYVYKFSIFFFFNLWEILINVIIIFLYLWVLYVIYFDYFL